MHYNETSPYLPPHDEQYGISQVEQISSFAIDKYYEGTYWSKYERNKADMVKAIQCEWILQWVSSYIVYITSSSFSPGNRSKTEKIDTAKTW